MAFSGPRINGDAKRKLALKRLKIGRVNGHVPLSRTTLRQKREVEPTSHVFSKRPLDILHCKVCNFKTTVASGLKTHVTRIHIKVNVRGKFECKVCLKSFAFSRDLVQHKNESHFNLRLHACRLCDMSFSRAHQLIAHMKADHGRFSRFVPRRSCLTTITTIQENESNILVPPPEAKPPVNIKPCSVVIKALVISQKESPPTAVEKPETSAVDEPETSAVDEPESPTEGNPEARPVESTAPAAPKRRLRRNGVPRVLMNWYRNYTFRTRRRLPAPPRKEVRKRSAVKDHLEPLSQTDKDDPLKIKACYVLVKRVRMHPPEAPDVQETLLPVTEIFATVKDVVVKRRVGRPRKRSKASSATKHNAAASTEDLKSVDLPSTDVDSEKKYSLVNGDVESISLAHEEMGYSQSSNSNTIEVGGDSNDQLLADDKTAVIELKEDWMVDVKAEVETTSSFKKETCVTTIDEKPISSTIPENSSIQASSLADPNLPKGLPSIKAESCSTVDIDSTPKTNGATAESVTTPQFSAPKRISGHTNGDRNGCVDTVARNDSPTPSSPRIKVDLPNRESQPVQCTSNAPNPVVQCESANGPSTASTSSETASNGLSVDQSKANKIALFKAWLKWTELHQHELPQHYT